MRWNRDGLASLEDQPRRGAKLPLDAEPRKEDGGCTLRGEDVRRILREEFGVGRWPPLYYLLHRLGYACLAPRPKNRKTDPERLTQICNEPSDRRLPVFHQDEAFAVQNVVTAGRESN